MILIGADPELFVKKDGKFISAYGLVPGTKDTPYVVEGGAIQVDGMALEINISPTGDGQTFLKNVNNVLNALREHLHPDLDMVLTETATFEEKYMDSVPEEAKVLGCDPDFNAYTGAENGAPDGRKYMRTAAGHIHIGWTQDADPADPVHFTSCMELTKELDYLIGLPLSLYEKNNARREMYGAAGSFRPKTYGLEYRVPSNVWLLHDQIIKTLLGRCMFAIESCKAGNKMSEKWGDAAKDAIDNGDYHVRQEVAEQARVLL